jgi:hypothetical protein
LKCKRNGGVDFDKNAIQIKSIKGGVARARMIPMTVSMRTWFLQKKNSNPLLAKAGSKVFLDDDGFELPNTRVSTAVNRVVKRMKCEGLEP